jgi:urocanate hydratase
LVPENTSETILTSVAEVYQAYASLMHFAAASEDPSLGGQFLYVGELDSLGRCFAVAANIAGAATLAASTDPSALRQAQREGAIDFLVNSLDEALRILKNEIRKRQPVAVAVSLAPESIESEMIERGVLPDLLPPGASAALQTTAFTKFVSQGSQLVSVPSSQAERRFLIWSAPAEYAQNLSAFESMLAEHLEPTDYINRRWLRLSPRYLGSHVRRLRSLCCDELTTRKLTAEFGPPLRTSLG